jgi:hypothetical protein
MDDEMIYTLAPRFGVRELYFPEAVTDAGHRLREMRGMYVERPRCEWRVEALQK